MIFFEYKGYTGSIEYSAPDEVLYGKVLGIRSLISYEGETIQSLKQDFEEAVDDYFEICEEDNTAPEIPIFSPEQLQLSPDMLEDVIACSKAKGTSFHEVVEKAVGFYLETWKKSPETV